MEPQNTREQQILQQVQMLQGRLLERGQMLASLASQVTGLEQELVQTRRVMSQMEAEIMRLRGTPPDMIPPSE